MISAVFLALVLLHLVYSIVTNRGGGDPSHMPPTRMGAITQVPMFAIAVYFGIENGMLSRDLVSPVHIAIGLGIGHLIFAWSILVTHMSVSDASTHLLDTRGPFAFCVEAPYVVSRFITVSLAEEIIWRVALQPILISATASVTLGIALTAIGFAVVHHHFFRNSLVVSLEFTAFALLLGFLYYWTGSLILVIVIHAVRDIEIAYIEYLVKVHELGDAEKAEQEIAALYMPRRRLERL